MGAIGQRSHIGIAKETTFGTPVGATDYLKFNSESITESIEEVVSAQLGRRDEPDSYHGLKSVAGDIVSEVHPKFLGHLLRSWFGAPSTTSPDSGVYLHEFTPGNAAWQSKSENPSYTLELYRDVANAWQISGAVANALAFNFGTGQKILQLTASMLCKDATLITKTSPSLETTDPFLWNQSVIGIALVDTGTATGTQSSTTLQDTSKSWGVDVNANKYIRLTGGTGESQVRKITSNTSDTLTVPTWDLDPVTASSTYEIFDFNKEVDTMAITLENGLVAKGILDGTQIADRIVADSFRLGTLAPTFKVENQTEYNKFAAYTGQAWRIIFEGGVFTGGWKYQLSFEFPSVLYTAFPVNVGGPAEIMAGATGKIKYDATAGHLCKVKLRNEVASY